MPPRVFRAQFSKEELRSPLFSLPSTNRGPYLVRSGQYTWDVEPYVEDKERVIRLSCSKCSKTYYSYWPIHATNAKTHYEKYHSEGSHSQSERDSSSVLIEDQSSSSSSDGGSFRKSPSPRKRFEKAGNGISLTPARKRSADVLSYDDASTDALWRFYVATNQSFSLSDCTSFQNLLKCAKPPTSSTCSDAYLKLRENYQTQFSYLKSMLAKNESRFVEGMNEWNIDRNNLAVANLRFYNDNFGLERHTIGFEGFKDVEFGLAGYTLWKRLPSILDQLDIKDRILAINKSGISPLGSEISNAIDSFCRDLQSPIMGYDEENAGHVLRFTTETILDHTFFTQNTTGTFEESLKRTMSEHPHYEMTLRDLKKLPLKLKTIVSMLQIRDVLKGCYGNEIQMVKKVKPTSEYWLNPLSPLMFPFLETHRMLDKILYFRKEITEVLNRVRCLPTNDRESPPLSTFEITEMDWDYIVEVRNILNIFRGPILALQCYESITFTCTIHFIYEILNKIHGWTLSRSELTDPFLSLGVKQAYAYLLDHYSMQNAMNTQVKTVYIATVLDPRFKLGLFEDSRFSLECVSSIISCFRAVYEQYKRAYETRQDELSDQQNIELSIFDKGITYELETYLSQGRVAWSTSLVAYFKDRRRSLPIIYRMAKDFLAVPAISTPPAPSVASCDLILESEVQERPSVAEMKLFLRSGGSLDESDDVSSHARRFKERETLQ